MKCEWCGCKKFKNIGTRSIGDNCTIRRKMCTQCKNDIYTKEFIPDEPKEKIREEFMKADNDYYYARVLKKMNQGR